MRIENEKGRKSDTISFLQAEKGQFSSSFLTVLKTVYFLSMKMYTFDTPTIIFLHNKCP